MQTKRTFIALDFPLEIRQKIRDITAYFKTQLPPGLIKWVDPDNMHLTLKFMGETPPEKLADIKHAIYQLGAVFPVFSIEIEDLGMYPNSKHPRVIWLGIKGENNLITLHNQLDQALNQIGIQPEKRPFSPHLTIARVRRSANQDSVLQIGKTLSQFKVSHLGTVHVHEIVYYQSDLTPQGPNYTILQTTPMNKV